MKWIGAVATVLLLVVWVGSAWIDVGFVATQPRIGLQLGQGQILVGWQMPSRSRHWRWEMDAHGFMPIRWWVDHFVRPNRPLEIWCIPLWPFILLTGAPTVLMWRQDRRRRLAELSNSCRKCGYSRSGLPAHRPCPECGTPRST